MGCPGRWRNECFVVAERNDIPCPSSSDFESTAGKPGQNPFSQDHDISIDSGAQTALAIGAFSTTLTTLALALMEFRGLTVTNVFIGDFFFVAGVFAMESAS